MAELFSIQCETCRSRLKVRKRSAIGQVLKCPKCENGVKVVPPEDWVDPDRDTVNVNSDPARVPPSKKPANAPSRKAKVTSEARHDGGSEEYRDKDEINEPAFEDIDGLLENFDPSTLADSSLPAAAAASTDAAHDAKDFRDAEEEQTSSVDAGDENDAAADGPLVPNDQWISKSTRDRQRLMMVIGGAIAALVMAAAMITYLVFRMGDLGNDAVAQGSESSEQNDAGSNDDQLTEQDSDPNGQSDDDDSTSSNDSNTADDASSTDDTNNDQNAHDQNASDHNDNDQNSTSVSPDDDSNDAQTDDGNSSDANDTTSDDGTPPGFQVGDEGSRDPNFAGDPILRGLGTFDSFLEDNGSTEAAEAARQQRRDEDWSIYDASAPFVEKPRDRVIHVGDQLAMPIVELKQEDVRFLDFVDLMCQLSGVPISIDASVLQMESIQSLDRLDIHHVDMSIGEALNAQLNDLELTFVEREQSIHVVPTEALLLAYEDSHVVDDLLDGFPNGFDDLNLILKAMIAPNSWEEQGGVGTMFMQEGILMVTQLHAQQLQVRRFLELLRTARQVDGPSDSSNAVDFRQFAIADECLQESITIQIYQPLPLSEVVRQLNERANIELVLDWESLSQEGWTWDTELPLVAEDKTVEFALRRLAVSLDLKYQVVGPRQFILLSRNAFEQQSEFAFYDCAALLEANINIEDFATQIRRAFPDAGLGEPVYPFYYDAPSQYLVARLTQSEHRSLNKFIGAWIRTAESMSQ